MDFFLKTAYPVESVATKRSQQKRGSETIERWYRQYFGSNRDERRSMMEDGGLVFAELQDGKLDEWSNRLI